MKRIILLSAVLLACSQWFGCRAEQHSTRPSRPKKTAHVLVTIQTSDGTVQITEGPSGEGLLASASDSEETAADWDFPEDHNAVTPAPSTRGVTHVVSDLMSTPERAEQDARTKLEQSLTEWLMPEVKPGWKAPSRLVNGLVLGPPALREIERDYATLEQAALKVDLSAKQRAAFIKAYHKEEGRQRMGLLGGVLAFVLACLGMLVGYIRADERTKGYYTTRLRLLAVAGVGAAGYGLYHFLT
jgi:hypothetical protein